jgi:nicotinate-nucleotide pyrophosphorylase (carboxylating)
MNKKNNSMDERQKKMIACALNEDIGKGDITTAATIASQKTGRARIISKQKGILAGTRITEYVFTSYDPKLQVKLDHRDGDTLVSNEIVMVIEGNIAAILSAERVALNYLGHLSGVATLTAQYVQKIRQTKAKIVDTRKTTPLLRVLEKEAVRAGGGINHRMGLDDMVLIKENHIQAAGSIINAVEQTQRFLTEMKLDVRIVVDTRNLDEVHEALTCGIDRIMLDNMIIDELREAVALINHQVEVEASGGITLENVREIALCGVDYISVGAITHSAPAFDYSLMLDEVKHE